MSQTRTVVLASGAALALLAGVVAVALFCVGNGDVQRPVFDPPAALVCTSDQLQHTVIVPTLDTPIPKGKNIIWCGSFQMAWSHLGDDVIGEPPQVAGAEEICARLNAAQFSEADLPPDSYYAEAGYVRDGIRERIADEMQRRFGRKPELSAAHPEEVIVAYAFLRANVPFSIPFFDNREEFVFTDWKGEKTSVKSFGIRPKDEAAYRQLRAQVEVLCAGWDPSKHSIGLAEYILDPCRDSEPYQLILALVEPKPTLQDTLADVEHKIATEPDPRRWPPHELGPNDVLLIPNFDWEITHHFAEMEGRERVFLNQGFGDLYLGRAEELVRFRLDRSGAELESESALAPESMPLHYVFDKPFLVYIKKRGGDRPFFVMWVDNAELLSPF
jgi:hypothetical protein